MGVYMGFKWFELSCWFSEFLYLEERIKRGLAGSTIGYVRKDQQLADTLVRRAMMTREALKEYATGSTSLPI